MNNKVKFYKITLPVNDDNVFKGKVTFYGYNRC